MLVRHLTLIMGISVCAAESGCTPGPGSSDPAKTSAGNAAGSRITDLRISPATRRLYGANEWVSAELRPSPDGRYISMTDWSTGNLALRDLTTHSMIALTHKASFPDDFAETSLISPDGKSIAYGWYAEANRKFDLRVMSLAAPDSGKSRVVYAGTPQGFTMPQSWTPDSRNIIAIMQIGDGTTGIALIPASGGEPKRIRSFDWRYPDDLSLSPDGRWLAYDFPSEENSGMRDVFVISLNGEGERAISSEKGDDFVVGWTRDGSRLLYGSERSGARAVWAMPMSNGRSTGSPVLVRSDMWRMFPLGITRAGNVFYGVHTGTRDSFVAPMDPVTGRVTSAPKAMNAPVTISPFSLAWSPDSKHLAQVILRGHRPGVYGPSDILIRSVEQDDERRLTPRLSRITGLSWLPDGSALIVRGANMKGRYGIYSVDLKTAKMRVIAESPKNWLGRLFALEPAGRNAYFVEVDTLGGSYITRLDLQTGAMQRIHAFPAPKFMVAMAVSPDGRHLMLAVRGGEYDRGIIAQLPVTGGTLKEIYRFNKSEAPVNGTGFAWSREGRELLFGVVQASDTAYAKIDVRVLSISDGTVRPLGIPPGKIAMVRVSRDGRRIAYNVNDMVSELWMMDEPVFDSSVAGKDRGH